MKTLTAILAIFLAMPAGFAVQQNTRLARVTVYWASGGKGSDRYTRHHKTSTGVRLCNGHCAVDPRHIPYGSKVVLNDGTTLAAVDTGTAVKNRKAARRSGRTSLEKSAIVIDRFFETKAQALAWSRTHPMFMPVQVVPPNARPSLATPLRAQPAQQPVQPAYAVVSRNQVQQSLAKKFAGSSAVVSTPKTKPAPAQNKYPLLASNDTNAKPANVAPAQQPKLH